MISSQAMCRSFLAEQQAGIHDWTVDQFKLALYQQTAILDPDIITAYTPVNETVGVGYVAGGFNLVLTPGFPQTVVIPPSRRWLVDFQDIYVNPAMFSTRRALIYNASKANRAVSVLEWGYTYSPSINFLIEWPPNDPDNCLIRLGA